MEEATGSNPISCVKQTPPREISSINPAVTISSVLRKPTTMFCTLARSCSLRSECSRLSSMDYSPKSFYMVFEHSRKKHVFFYYYLGTFVFISIHLQPRILNQGEQRRFCKESALLFQRQAPMPADVYMSSPVRPMVNPYRKAHTPWDA